VVTLEEGCEPGGFGAAVSEALARKGLTRPWLSCAIPDQIVQHGDSRKLLDELGLSPDALFRRITAFHQGLPALD
jgi:1-deoxy-D-xylulose-5-phosphate synthase